MTDSNRFRTLLHVLLLKLLNHVISTLPSYAFCTGSKSLNASNASSVSRLHNFTSVEAPRSSRSSFFVTFAWPPTSSSLRNGLHIFIYFTLSLESTSYVSLSISYQFLYFWPTYSCADHFFLCWLTTPQPYFSHSFTPNLNLPVSQIAATIDSLIPSGCIAPVRFFLSNSILMFYFFLIFPMFGNVR